MPIDFWNSNSLKQTRLRNGHAGPEKGAWAPGSASGTDNSDMLVVFSSIDVCRQWSGDGIETPFLLQANLCK